jgi:4-amino-4-deoxy-L-arabinose transferase-like glycosyltransferase
MDTMRARRSRQTPVQPADVPDASDRAWLLALLVVGTLIRLALWWRNPVANSFDDHYEPVRLIFQSGAIPGKLDCFQCFHPPVFYALAAALAKGLLGIGLDGAAMVKTLQLLNCAFGIATLVVLYALLRRLPVSAFARLVAFSLVVFLPRHIYMSAMFANDAAAVFFVAVSAYLAVRFLQGSDRWGISVAMAGAATAGVFTKYTALAALPMIAVAVGMRLAATPRDPRLAARAAVAVLVPVAILGLAMASHARTYGAVLPDNTALYNPIAKQPRDVPSGVTFTTFEPWRFIAHPILRPGQLSSFWTLLHAGLWFDTEPRFGIYLGSRMGWNEYYAWLNGNRPYPGAPAPEEHMHLGSALEAFGLAWLLLGLAGAAELVRRRPVTRETIPLVVLLVFTVVGVGYLTLKLPVFAAMKASYLLGAVPAFAALTALGAERLERYRVLRDTLSAVVAAFAVLVIAHVAYLVWEMRAS